MKHAKDERLTLKDVLLTSRPFWWITTMVPFIAGFIVTRDLKFSWDLLVGGLYFLIPYNLLMYGINDIFDYESDIRNPRKSGIAGAVLAKAKHKSLFLLIMLCNVPFWIYFAVSGTVMSSIFFSLIVLMALAYSVKGIRFKEVPILDSLTSSFHYTSPFVFGVLLAGGTDIWAPAFAAFFLWAASNHAFGAIQDIKPDKEAGIASIATRLGSERTLVICISLYAVAALLPSLYYGAHGIFVSLVLLTYAAIAINTLPQRANHEHSVFRQSWHLFTYLNYINGALITIYLLAISYL